MNERIKELYQQAHSIRRYDGDPALDGNPPTVYWQGEVSAQRFAELIVRECIGKCEFVANMATITNTGEMARKTKATADSCATMIRQHFGVEE